MDLLGRETELASVDRAVEEARAGGARALGMFGEAGIGKSALLDAVRERAQAAGMLVLEGRAAEYERTVPFGLVVDALDDHVATLHPRRVESVGPDLAAVLPAAAAARSGEGEPDGAAAGAAERFRYHRAVRALLELLGRERPVALLLDDLHWADDASVELVLHLLRRPPRAPHLLAFALRPQEPAPRLLAAARSAAGWEHLTPGPLGDTAAHALVAGLADAGLRERVVREAGGNPLFLEELRRVARDPGEALPATLMAAVQLEIGMLGPEARALIEGAAVAGDPFDPELAAAAAGVDPAVTGVPLDRLVAADLVRATGDGRAFAFRHPLVRRAVYDAAPPAWRLAAHERASVALAERGAGPAARAHHVERSARQGDLAAVELLTAAGFAAADTAPAVAARRFAAALRLLPHDAPERRAALLGPLALAQGAAGRLVEARDTLDEVLRLLPPDDSSPQRVGLIAAAATIDGMLGRGEEMQRRLRAAAATTPPAARAVLEVTLGFAAYGRVDFAAMRDHCARARELARPDEPTIRAAAEAMGGLATLLLGEPDAGRALIDAGIERLAALDDAALAARIDDAWLVAVALLLSERPQEGLRPLGRAIGVARSTRQDRVVPMLLSLRSMMHQHRLALGEAMEDAEAASEAARLLGTDAQLHQALMVETGIRHLRGERTEARRIADEATEIARRVEPTTQTATTLANCAAQWVDDDPERCIREMVAGGGPLLERVDLSWSTWLLGVLVRAAIELGRTDDAERWTARIEERAALTGMPGAAARAATARARVLLDAGEAAAAAEMAGAAADRAEARGLRLDALVARHLAGQALAASGDRQGAVALLQRVAADAARGEVGRYVEATSRDLRRLGSRVSAAGRRAAGARDEALTPRERDIADLVAQGRSNKQVAAALFLSEKTIEHNLSRIYAKLGVRSRVELAARLPR